MNEIIRTPNNYDYLAGAILTNGFVLLWINVIPSLPLNKQILADISYLIYLSAIIISSILVCRKTSSKHLLIGIKLAIITWILSIPIFLTTTTSSLRLALTLLLIYVFGSIVGAYVSLRLKLKS